MTAVTQTSTFGKIESRQTPRANTVVVSSNWTGLRFQYKATGRERADPTSPRMGARKGVGGSQRGSSTNATTSRVAERLWARLLVEQTARMLVSGLGGVGCEGLGGFGCGVPGHQPHESLNADTQHPTPNSQHPTSNIQHQHPTSNIQHPTPNIQHPTPNTQHHTPYTQHTSPKSR